MFGMNKRSYQPELMDLGPSYYTAEEYRDCLRKLGTIGRLLGGDRATFKDINRLSHVPTSILDVGCGGGWFTCRLAHRYPNAQVLGIDIDPQALYVARENIKIYEQQYNVSLKNLSFEHRTSPRLSEPEHSFDVVTATLLCHHLKDHELITFLGDAYRIARKAVILNDLHRHWLAYALFWLLSPFFFNRLIRYDGLLSIKRAFTRAELESYCAHAGIAIRFVHISWHWAFRWIVRIDTL
jgi:2-polyprenyl-3-methyl-5-hydroxy-6-metoxy-1,4-benzoquinol methylase